MSNAPTSNTPVNCTDWDRIARMDDADIAFDADNPQTSQGDWDGAVVKRAGKVIGHVPVRTRGAQKAPTKVQTAIRFDADVLEGLRATGRGWQTRVNAVMRQWLAEHR